MSPHLAANETELRAWRIQGQVQGVGFRPFVYRLATELGLSGAVGNDASGVTLEAWGELGALDALERRIVSDAPALARIDRMERVRCDGAAPAARPFRIVESDHTPAERGRVTVDAAVCDDCLREMRDAADRRFRHALVNCTNCGPRFTIVRDLPYDRPLTTMAGFPMCRPCAEEYADPGDRRFHAQPTCCPTCGPRLGLIRPDGSALRGDPIEAAAALLRQGRVLAMKGLGGYHLVADATSEAAVGRLRRGKRRDYKPFAVMVRALVDAERIVRLSEAARGLLASPVSPIVLAPRRDETGADAVAPSVAPGCHRLGIMLPYTPMQHLLFDEGLGPLVMTSANLSDDPLISDDADARARLAEICDALLLHDRPIERAVDDSIVIDAPFGILPIRRARGLVPTPLTLPVPAREPGLCVGGELKGAVTVVRGDQAVLGHHLGDLTYTLAYERFERTIEDLLRLFDVAPRWVACDAHPGYLSHQHARRLAAERDLELITVQHHHAHLAALLAEHGRIEPIVGLIRDGVGYGADGSAWGGEVMVGDLAGYERVGHMRPLRLPGGDAAARRTGRCAASWIFDTLGAEAFDGSLAARLLEYETERDAVRSMLEHDLNCPPSSGMGRLFDAAAALLDLCAYNHFEAMSGMSLEAAAIRAAERPSGGGFVLLREPAAPMGPFQLDHAPLLRRLLDGLETGADAGALSWLFHDALADGLARAAIRVATERGLTAVGVSGGVFCNTLLTELVRERVEQAGLEVLAHASVPPNDGGIAYGQAGVAARLTSDPKTR
jgi:hydrogenase maturation protein HypF